MQILTQSFAVCSNNLEKLLITLCEDIYPNNLKNRFFSSQNAPSLISKNQPLYSIEGLILQNQICSILHRKIPDSSDCLGIAENKSTDSLLSFRVIVPSASIRAWLTLKLTSLHIPILSGEILILKEALEFNQLSGIPQKALFPALIVFLHTIKHVQEYASFFNIFGYFNSETISNEHICSIAKKSLVHFALGLFLNQKTWFIKTNNEKLFGEFFLFSRKSIHYNLKEKTNSLGYEEPTFLFGFSSINQEAFSRLRSTFCIKKLYLLSPCMLFWGDLCSDDEIRNLLKKNTSDAFEKAYEPFFLNRQKLLANSGHIGREFLNFIEDLSLPSYSAYTIQEELMTAFPYAETIPQEGITKLDIKKTLLEYVKADLLLLISKRSLPEHLELYPNKLKNREFSDAECARFESEKTGLLLDIEAVFSGSKMECSAQEKTDSSTCLGIDSSIEIHSALTPLREVESLYEYLSSIFGQKSIPPSSVLVLATDLKHYRAPFEQVFGGKSSVSYQVFGEPQDKDLLPFLEILFSFLSSQGSKEDLLPLLKHEYFTKSFSLSPSDIDEIIQHILSLFFFSVTCSQRTEYLKNKNIIEEHKEPSLQDIYKEKLSSLFDKKQEEVFFEPVILSFFAQFFHYLETIQESMPLPINPQKILPLSSWLSLFEITFSPYFLSDTKGTFEAVQNALFSLNTYNTKALLSLSDALSLFFSELTERLVLPSSALCAPIILAEFGSFQPFPAEVIAILGAEEGSLPKDKSALNELQYFEKLPPTLYPSSKLFERYAFIEALISAKNFFIGFQSYLFDLRESVLYAPPIADLVSHLDSNYILNGKKPSEAILHSHPLYIPKQNLCDQSTHASIAPLYGVKKEKPFTFSDILKAAKSPIDVYLNHTFGAVDEWENPHSIFINPWEIRTHIEETLLQKKIFSKRSHSLARQAFESSSLEISKTLNSLGISSPQNYTLEFLVIINTIKNYSPSDLLAPLMKGLKNPFLGKIYGLFEEGMILFSDNWKKELFQRWPECILRAILAQEGVLPLKENLILVKEKKIIPLSISSPKDVCSSWTEYAELVKTVPFPFSFDIVSFLVKELIVPHELFAKIQTSQPYPSLSNTYLKNMSIEDVEKYISTWKEWAKILYGDFFKNESIFK